MIWHSWKDISFHCLLLNDWYERIKRVIMMLIQRINYWNEPINDVPVEQVCQVTYNGLCQSQRHSADTTVRGGEKKSDQRRSRVTSAGKDIEKFARIIDFIWMIGVKRARWMT